ncbi:MAG: ATPase, T2SS/T4P/T4SS family [Clostridia bacterium]|nr:ATPase, T2SS/T4P/T4SS family [Clostridia bacterium]
MLINPFKLDKNDEEKIIIKKEIDFKEIQKYMIAQHSDDIKNNEKEKIREKLKELLINTYAKKDDNSLIQIINKVINNMFGYGILQKHIENERITDIRVVKYNSVFIKSLGKWRETEDKFESDSEFEEYIRYTILKNKGSINFDSPMVVASDKEYNLRIEAGITPVNSISPSLVIRIHRPNQKITLESLLIIDEMLDKTSYKMIIDAISNKKNIILAGKGGSGKTTLLRAVIDEIPNEASICINEETTELYIDNKNVIQREVIENRENSKKITLEKLMKHSLVMSNDVIVVGELKGAEASVFIDSIGTGHMGLTTIHSDSIYNVLRRLVILFKRDEKTQQYSEEFVENILASSIDYIVYLKEYKVTQIAIINNNHLDIIYDKEAKP